MTFQGSVSLEAAATAHVIFVTCLRLNSRCIHNYAWLFSEDGAYVADGGSLSSALAFSILSVVLIFTWLCLGEESSEAFVIFIVDVGRSNACS